MTLRAVDRGAGGVRLGLLLGAALAIVACGASSGGQLPAAVKGALATPHPLSVQVAVDNANATSAVIGPGGGQVSATTANGARLTLQIPAGALLSSHTITLTPLATVKGFPLRGGVVAGAQLGPDGLLLARAATLNVTIASPPSGGMNPYGFGFRRGGAELHLIKASRSGTSFALSIWHFSGAGVGAGSSGDAAAQAANVPTNSQDQVEQAQALGLPYVQLLLGWDAQLTGELGQLPPNLPLLDSIYQQTLVFEAFATLAGRADLVHDIYLKIALVLKTAAQLALTNCKTVPDAAEGLRVIRWIEWAQQHPLILQHLDSASLEAGVVACLRFKLDFMTHENFVFGPEAIDLMVESKGIAINALTAVPLKFAPAHGDLKYDSYKWSVPGIQYTMSLTVDRPFAVEDVMMNLDLVDTGDNASIVDGMSLTVDFGDTSETATVVAPFPVPPLPFKSFYANGMENMHHSSAVGPHLYAIRGWAAGTEPQFASLHETCPCTQVPAAAGALTETQDTMWVLSHTPS